MYLTNATSGASNNCILVRQSDILNAHCKSCCRVVVNAKRG